MNKVKRLGVSSKTDVEDKANISHVGASQVFENGNQVKQLVVVGVGEPATNGDRVLGMENVRRRRVVDDDGVFQVSSHLRKILDVVSMVIVAALAEQPVVYDLVDIQLIQKRVAILRQVACR